MPECVALETSPLGHRGNEIEPSTGVRSNHIFRHNYRDVCLVGILDLGPQRSPWRLLRSSGPRLSISCGAWTETLAREAGSTARCTRIRDPKQSRREACAAFSFTEFQWPLNFWPRSAAGGVKV